MIFELECMRALTLYVQAGSTTALGEKRIERRKTNYSITKVFCCSLPNKLPKIMRHYTFCDTPGARNSPFSVHFFHEYITARHYKHFLLEKNEIIAIINHSLSLVEILFFAKGQLISRRSFGVFKKLTKNFPGFPP